MNTMMKSGRQVMPHDRWQNFFNPESFFSDEWLRSSKLPAVNISEDDKNFYIDVVAPGFKKDDFTINVDDDMLTISAETKMESEEKDNNNKQYNRREYSYNSFTRSFQLPDNVKDTNIEAKYADGILKLNLLKSEQKAKPKKQIAIG
ncbi:MAG TPA: Hsp20/alpha crystallin family protein [Puia sp.]|nr:Hsp20/alpha crystallin family protein [Puia sp.]